MLLSCIWRCHRTAAAYSYSKQGCACEACRHLLTLHIMQLQTDLSGTCCILNMQLCRNIAARDSQGACAAVVPIASWTTLNVPSGICRHILMSQTLMLKSSVVIITTIMITLSSLSKARYMQDKQSLTAIKHPDETGACIWSGFLSQQTGVPAGIFSGSVSFSLHSGQLPLQPTHLHHKSSYSAAVHQHLYSPQ